MSTTSVSIHSPAISGVASRDHHAAKSLSFAAAEQELGPYTLKSPLGSGGMGEVFLAEHRLLKRLCAVKLIHPDKASDSAMKNRFEREVKVTATLTHPNTIEVYDYGTTASGRFFYAMEYLNGLNLQQFVKRFGPLSPGRTVFILRQICSALHEAHSAGLVHRDIKPSNIFLSERGRMYDVAKLLDFGLVRASMEVGLQRVNTQIQGSPAFMCPEQARGQEPDCRGDLYSLGAVAYFLLTGRPPFDDPNPLMLIVAHATTAIPNFADVGVTVPDELTAIIMKCLAKKQEDRYESSRNLLLALESCEASSQWTWRHAEDWWLDQGEHGITLPHGLFSHHSSTPSADLRDVHDSSSDSDSDKTLIFETDTPV